MSAAPLTARQLQVHDFISEHLRRAGYPPTIREMAAHFGVTPRAIHCRLILMKKKGAIAWDSRISRGITLLPLAGRLGTPVSLPGALFFPVT